jgi:hypothetical protein
VKIKIKLWCKYAFYFYRKGAFDLLNRWLDVTTFVVSCLIQKPVMVLDKIDSKGQDKNKNLCPSLSHSTTFCPWYNYKKYKNTHFIFEYKKYYLSFFHRCNFVLSCSILCCSVLFCSVLTVLQIKRTLYDLSPNFDTLDQYVANFNDTYIRIKMTAISKFPKLIQ